MFEMVGSLLFVLGYIIHIVVGQCPATPGSLTINTTFIADNAFSNCQTITFVIIPSTVIKIGIILLLNGNGCIFLIINTYNNNYISNNKY